MPALLFDIGNVLVTFDFSPFIQHLTAHSPLSAAEISQTLAPIKDAFESGQSSADTFVSQSMTALRYSGSAEQFRHAWCHIFTAHEPMAQTLSSLSHQLPSYLLSNTNGLHKDYLLNQFSVFSHFSGGIYSHEAKCMKPQLGIFHQAIDRFHLDPSQTFYVDDLIANIQAGEQLGFHCFHYDPQNHSALDVALREWMQSL
jgi:glucose-1-phosphatase